MENQAGLNCFTVWSACVFWGLCGRRWVGGPRFQHSPTSGAVVPLTQPRFGLVINWRLDYFAVDVRPQQFFHCPVFSGSQLKFYSHLFFFHQDLLGLLSGGSMRLHIMFYQYWSKLSSLADGDVSGAGTTLAFNLTTLC